MTPKGEARTDERDLFEDWVKGRIGWFGPVADVAWITWQARAALTQSRTPEPAPPGVNAEAWNRLGITRWSALACIRNDEELRLYVQACIEESVAVQRAAGKRRCACCGGSGWED